MNYTVQAFWAKNNYVLLSSNFPIFVSNILAMLHIFYTQLMPEDSIESCLWLWVNFYFKGSLV